MVYFRPTNLSCPHYIGSIFTNDRMTHSILNAFPDQLPPEVKNLTIPGFDADTLFETKQGAILFLNLLECNGVTHVNDIELFEDEDFHTISEYEEFLMSTY